MSRKRRVNEFKWGQLHRFQSPYSLVQRQQGLDLQSFSGSKCMLNDASRWLVSLPVSTKYLCKAGRKIVPNAMSSEKIFVGNGEELSSYATSQPDQPKDIQRAIGRSKRKNVPAHFRRRAFSFWSIFLSSAWKTTLSFWDRSRMCMCLYVSCSSRNMLRQNPDLRHPVSQQANG